ncbi:uncharacterized protein [Spinacia oleracea]|uniref:Endonuclease/exonuclease/phosphatase domain-containing protein n=1 Tax=Spinacia oleracea TaxID=3562 RepID=A0ABM3RR61_SPIOL|nr:uncharacterized protein LOC110775603 [Spinacia oleracea]
MNICSWNVRGMNDPSKVGDIKNFVNVNQISVVALIETRVKLKNSSKIQNKFGAQWHWVSNYDHSDRGRIWIGWKHRVVTFTVVYKSEQIIHGIVSAKSANFTSGFTAVYGLHSIETRRPLWRELSSLSALNNLAWLVMGDFNSVLYSGDRVNGHEVHRISSRIDRAFGNSCWQGTYSDVVVDYMNPGLSDHTPLVMNYKVNMKKGGRPFKFFNYMADHPQFFQAVQKGWEKNTTTSAMQNVWSKLKAVKVELKALHKQEFAQLETNIEKCRRDLEMAQSISIANPDDSVVQEKEKECVAKLKLFLKVQESAYRQKSRIQWLQLGDSNSKFFFSSMKERYAINSTDVLYDDHGTKLTTEADIQTEIKNFYGKLIGSVAASLTGIDVPIVRHGIQLSAADADSLIIPISDLEIDTAIKGINVNKAPGLDGFNSLFFHKTWNIVKADIYNAIREFFDTGVLLKPINNTAVTLIPKIQNASTVKDFRPIACCYVVYKIISKILTARMQGVIGKCLGSVSYSILVNGFPTKPIPAKKGLRQGDPISPYLFAIDDLLMFARADIPSVSAIFQAFTKFSKASGLEANLHKSDVYVAGVSDTAASQIVDSLGIAKGSFPFTYLGVPLTTRKLNYNDCKPLIEKTVARIKIWATKFLSYAGRLQLVEGNNALGNEGSARAPVAWESLCLPKSCGGWNLKDLTVWNKAAVLKHCWALSIKQDRLRIKWMHTYYVKHHNFRTMQVPNGLTWSMRKIWAHREVFVDSGEIDQVWSSVLSKIGVDRTIQTWQGEIDWEAKKSRGTKPRDKICSMAFVETVYNIWLQRNSKVFKNIIDSVDVTSSRIVFLIACRCDDQMRKCLI